MITLLPRVHIVIQLGNGGAGDVERTPPNLATASRNLITTTTTKEAPTRCHDDHEAASLHDKHQTFAREAKKKKAATMADVPLQVVSENSASERRITPSWTIGQLKARLEPITGIPPLSQTLSLRVKGAAGPVAIQAVDEENTRLDGFGLVPYAELHVRLAACPPSLLLPPCHFALPACQSILSASLTGLASPVFAFAFLLCLLPPCVLFLESLPEG